MEKKLSPFRTSAALYKTIYCHGYTIFVLKLTRSKSEKSIAL
jgi:hypothetical protein